MAPIRPLPPQTIDRIAAGEVIQRPSAIIKELIENSLDASSTKIDVISKQHNLDVSVTDDGCGIDADSLSLACTRFATSKIVQFDDLKAIKTFGFRGEALASCSMVGRVTVTSRRRGDRCAYKLNFRDGAPISEFGSNNEEGVDVKPKPCAGKEGTTILVQDLFYNVPSRRRAMEGKRNEREEYDRILTVVQRYAVHGARRGVGFLCRGSGRGGKQCDLNTQSLSSVKKIAEKRKQNNSDDMDFGAEEMAAVKDVIGHVFGSDVIRELLPLRAGEGDVNAVGLEALKAMAELNADNIQDIETKSNDHDEKATSIQSVEESNRLLLEEMMKSVSESLGQDNKSPKAPTNNETPEIAGSTNSKFSFAFKARGLITNGSYSAPKSSAAFLLFINDRLVESPSLRRAVESIYADTLPKGGKPFIYLSLELPGPHIDVNVHPTKKEVALLHEDQLCDALMAAVREVIGSATSSRTFAVAGSLLLRPEKKQSVLIRKRDATELKDGVACDDDELNKQKNDSQSVNAEDSENEMAEDDDMKISDNTAKRKLDSNEGSKTTSTKKRYDPSRLVRTNHAALAGALEPFLVKKDSVVNSDSTINSNNDTESKQSINHQPECPLSSQTAPDMSLPGAFATAICRCQVKEGDSLPPVSNGITVRSNPTNNVIRPRKITPTECDYRSITELRANIHMRNHQSLNETLRGSSYIGAISRNRSLIQCGIDLLMINHRDLACEVFYQLALLKFGDMPMAGLGSDGVHVMTVIGDYLQTLETDDIEAADSKLDISQTNTSFARQAVARLAEKAPMLEDYFSIKFERRRVQGSSQRESLWLTGLPILLEGHSPQPYALPLFLIRLATEVNWAAEKPCFEGVCKEIGSYYAEIPLSSSNDGSNVDNTTNSNVDLIDDQTKAYVKHTLYPIVAHLLVPSKELATKGSVVKLANLTSLYKVFERC